MFLLSIRSVLDVVFTLVVIASSSFGEVINVCLATLVWLCTSSLLFILLVMLEIAFESLEIKYHLYSELCCVVKRGFLKIFPLVVGRKSVDVAVQFCDGGHSCRCAVGGVKYKDLACICYDLDNDDIDDIIEKSELYNSMVCGLPKCKLDEMYSFHPDEPL